jgi:hypothetical protein
MTSTELRSMLSNQLAVPLDVAAKAYCLGRAAAYRAAKRQEIENFRIGDKILCPTKQIRERLGLDMEAHAV